MAQVEAEHIGRFLAHTQIGEQQAALAVGLQLEKSLAESCNLRHRFDGTVVFDEFRAAWVGGPANAGVVVEQRVVALEVLVGRGGHQAPEHGVERCRRDEQALRIDTLRGQRSTGDAIDVLLGHDAPAQVGRAEGEHRHIPPQTAIICEPQRSDHAHDQGQGVRRVDDEYAAHREGVVGEWHEQLRAVNRHVVEQRMGDQHQPQRQPPPFEQIRLAMHPRDHPGQQGRKQREVEQRMALGAVAHHVEHRIAVVDHHIKVGQRACNGTPGGRFPDGCAPAHHRYAHGCAQRDLCQRIHARTLAILGTLRVRGAL